MRKSIPLFFPLLAASFLAACGSSDAESAGPKTEAAWQAEVTTGMHDALLVEIVALHDAAAALCADAPTGHGWDATGDAAAISAMRTDWEKARTAYEHVEGALAPLFPDVDFAIDARYDDFLTMLNGAGDPDPFDGEGVTGMHAIERILYADVTPPRVVELESTLAGYAAARVPESAAEADAFKTKLCAKLVSDVGSLRDQWGPVHIDLAGAYQGLISLMNEQVEKVNKASSGEEESRYAQRTMADLRDNLAGTRAVYGVFRPWIASKEATGARRSGAAVDAAIGEKMDHLAATYGEVAGAAIPEPPASWSAESPSEADLATPFGKLWTEVHATAGATSEGSIVQDMNEAAALLGFPGFVEE